MDPLLFRGVPGAHCGRALVLPSSTRPLITLQQTLRATTGRGCRARVLECLPRRPGVCCVLRGRHRGKGVLGGKANVPRLGGATSGQSLEPG